MNSNYVSPKVEIKNFILEDVITASGTNTKLTAVTSRTFNVADHDVSWSEGK